MNKMKSFIIGAALCLVATYLSAQNVNIPDVNFKNYLVENTAINTNKDAEIQFSEAAAFYGGIDCANLNITDLTGIETFHDLKSLHCEFNQLTSLDVSQNPHLTSLRCYNNQLTSLDVSQNLDLAVLACHFNQLTNLNLQNTNLTDLFCYYNQLTSLDVSQNTNLEKLSCFNNQLTSLDVSQNINLTALDCSLNQLTSLNAKNGNNVSITLFYVSSNPNLTCIQVDHPTYSTTSWTLVDTTASFSTNCRILTEFTLIRPLAVITSYPNPTAKSLTIDFGKPHQEVNLQITNLTGQIVLNRRVQNSSTANLELEGTAGIYFVSIQTEEGATILKVIKE